MYSPLVTIGLRVLLFPVDTGTKLAQCISFTIPYRMPPKLPAELNDAIIDHLHNDKASLATCALVCKGWVPASRHHLFRSVVIDPMHVAAFISLVQSPLSTIPGHISHFGMQDIRNLDKILILCLNCLHSVTSLCLMNFQWRLLEPATVALTQSTFGAVAELAFQSVNFNHFDQFAYFMSGFPRLQKLVVRQLSWKVETHTLFDRWIPPATLRVLDLDLCPLADIMGCMRTHLPVPPIHTVHFRGLTTRWLFGVRDFLHALGSSLEHLSLTYHFSDSDQLLSVSELCQHFDLSHNLSLRTIDLEMNLHQLFLPLSPLVKATPQLLSQITSSTMEEVSFRILVHRSSDLLSMDWDSLDRVFTQSQFARLKWIHISLGCCVDEDTARGWVNTISTKLPSCHSRCILHTTVLGV